MNEQAAALQDYIEQKNLSRLIEARHREGEQQGIIMTITSGKGGVGKSTLVLNLGLAAPERTLIVDGDFLLGDLSTLANEQSTVSWKEIFIGRRTWREAVYPIARTTDILAPQPFDSEKFVGLHASATVLSRLIREWKREYALILIDTASGLGLRVIEWSLVADHIVMVSTPDPTSCLNTYAIAKSFTLSGENPNLGMIINQYLRDENPWTIYKQLELMIQKMLNQSLDYWGAIPWVDDIAHSTRQQTPFLLQEAGRQWLSIFREIVATVKDDTQHITNSFHMIG
ncbi:MAG TPA: AAA family ATPase [bacterium]|nr:AAA family ATPase [bacterium]